MAFAQVVTHLAFATPFLLLPSCRSIHVVEGRHEPPGTLIFGLHHKTGNVLCKKDAPCFGSSFKYKLEKQWLGSPILPRERAVHFVRNPISLALSSYLYHSGTGEDWSLEPGSAWSILGEDPFLQQFILSRRESYTDFLRRVDAKIGIRAEIDRMSGQRGNRGGMLAQIETADKACQASSRCMQICLEDFTVSSSSYDASWRKVMSFMGKHMTPEVKECLSKNDLHRYPEDDSHITSNTLPAWRYTALREMVADVDRKAFNGMLKKMGEGRLTCGASLLHTQPGSNATDGDEDREWLIEDEYA